MHLSLQSQVYTQKKMFKKYNHIEKSSQSLVSNLQSLKLNHEILHKKCVNAWNEGFGFSCNYEFKTYSEI